MPEILSIPSDFKKLPKYIANAMVYSAKIKAIEHLLHGGAYLTLDLNDETTKYAIRGRSNGEERRDDFCVRVGPEYMEKREVSIGGYFSYHKGTYLYDDDLKSRLVYLCSKVPKDGGWCLSPDWESEYQDLLLEFKETLDSFLTEKVIGMGQISTLSAEGHAKLYPVDEGEET